VNEQYARVEGIPAGLTIRGLDRDQIPVADWLCACGHHERATGGTDVRDLTIRACPGRCSHPTGAAP
jgi:hypothetical protein